MPCKRKIQKPLKKNGVGITVGKWDGVSVCEVLEFSTNFHCWDLEIPSILLMIVTGCLSDLLSLQQDKC